ncbi:phosphate signaling complex protein PhoU [candidate division WOR-3 bacterium]|nr:phosphate signaling complex protein PhoU [candidate division WOR-3 bacterium]
MLHEKLLALKQNLTEYASFVENMIKKSIKGLLQKETELLTEVIEQDELKANDSEIEIDEMCITLIAQFQPKAKDLRTILMVLKMNNDLERIGDLAVNICESAKFLVERPEVKPLIDIPRMADETTKMLKDGINAFINEDAILAKNVCERDNIVDGLRNQILRELVTFMTSDATTIQRSLHLIRVSHNLERIADLSTNLCEDVIFIVKGSVIKHHKDEEE